MAEILIADKPTLDLVNTKTTTIQTTTNTINTNIGSNADAASATGSVHAKLKQLQQAQSPSIMPKKPRSGILNLMSSPPGTYTVVNISGQGKVSCINPGSSSTSGSITFVHTVITDGVTNVFTPIGNTFIPWEFYFNSTLVYQVVTSGTGTFNLNSYIFYALV